jgi:hypothetical protein
MDVFGVMQLIEIINFSRIAIYAAHRVTPSALYA